MIRVGIVGYGNLGRGVEAAVYNNPDMQLIAVFTRRNPATVKIATSGAVADKYDNLANYKGKIDIIVNCGGSATDMPVTTPAIAELFPVIDSFDTHARVPEHFANVDAAAKKGGNIAMISCGWDPGMFSLARAFGNAVLPMGSDYTFWGRGVSQGHSDAIRRIEGVIDARQYTVPVPEAVESVRKGENPELTTRQKHTRECWVAVEDGADKQRIENEIKTMPNYFADYDTTVNFISPEELKEKYSALPHGGSVIRSGCTGFNKDMKHTVEYSLKLDSNPEFTGSCLAAFARAVYKMGQEGKTGCITVFDVPPAYLLNMSADEIRAHLL